MSANVKIGDNTIQNAKAVRLESADTAGEYITFTEGAFAINCNVFFGSAAGSINTFGAPNTAQITITPNEGAELPQTITVTGAQYTYDDTTGVIVLTNATGDIAIRVVCIATVNITTNITNGTASGATEMSTDGTATVTITAASGYACPVTIAVQNADYTYNKANGQIVLSNAVDDVVITVVCSVVYPITKTITGGSASGATTIAADDTATVTLAAGEFYSLPETITVTNAQYTYNSANGSVILSEPTGAVSIVVECVEAAEMADT